MTPQNEDKWREELEEILGVSHLDESPTPEIDELLAWATEIDKQARIDELDYVAEVMNDQNEETVGPVTGQFIEGRIAHLKLELNKSGGDNG